MISISLKSMLKCLRRGLSNKITDKVQNDGYIRCHTSNTGHDGKMMDNKHCLKIKLNCLKGVKL